MFGSIGIPELLVVLMVSAISLVPVAALIWAVVTVHHMRVTQQEMAHRLSAIEGLLKRP